MPPKKPPSFSILINEKIAELSKFLQVAQFVAERDYLALSSNVEEYIQKLAIAIKQLQKLQQEGWQISKKPVDGTVYHAISTWGEKLLIERLYIKLGIVVDLALLFPFVTRVYYDDTTPIAFRLSIPSLPYIYVKPKCLPLPKGKKQLKQVMLKDGNVAWLEPSTLEKIRKFLTNLNSQLI